MRWLKFGIEIFLLLMAIYAVSMTFVDESKTIRIEKKINYPIEKVYPQFANLQKFSSWNDFFEGKGKMMLNFFIPYEGQGSSMNFKGEKKSSKFGDLFIRYAVPEKAIRYQLFEGKNSAPIIIEVVFETISASQTNTIWTVHTPKLPLLGRYQNLFSEDYVSGNIEKSMKNLSVLMSNKIDRDSKMAHIKYDSLMVENNESQIVLGVNVTTRNKKDELFKNIVLNHNKVKNFVMLDLGKKEDEFGDPILLAEPNNYKDKELSYYYGIPLTKKIGISDNNFIFRTLNTSKAYVIFYKGNFAGRTGHIQQLILKAKRDTMRNGELQETFLEEPSENKDCIMKIALPVFR